MYFVMLNSAHDVLLYSDESKQSNAATTVPLKYYGDTDMASKVARKAALTNQAAKATTSGVAGGSGFTDDSAGKRVGGGGRGGYQTATSSPDADWSINPLIVQGTAPTNRTSAPPSSGGGGYSTGGLTATAAGQYAMPSVPAMPSESDYLANDSTYIAEKSGIDATLAAALAAYSRDRAAYNADFSGALRNLGWQFQDPNAWESNPGAGSWREQDLTGAYGAAYNNQQNDFAGRGMIHSSMYGRALEDLLSSFDRQRNQMLASRTGQLNDWQAQEQAARDEARVGGDQAWAAAMARRAAMYGIG